MPLLGELSALLTACCWSGSSLAFAAATRRAGVFQVNTTRLILALTYLLLLIGAAQLSLKLSTTQIAYLSLSGIIGLALGDSFLFRAYQEIGARVTMLIMSLAPAIAAVLAYVLLGETLSALGVLGIVITMVGIGVVVLERSRTSSSAMSYPMLGIVLALLAATGQGAGLVFAKMAFREGEVNGFVATAVRIAASLVLLLPVAAATRRYESPVTMFARDRKAFYLTATGSVLGPFLGITFSLIAIEHTKIGIAATIMATVPILMLPLVRFLYKEHLTWRAIVGALVTVVGVGVLFLR
jgi:drug/metabolite transporter (DMT)-like permease